MKSQLTIIIFFQAAVIYLSKNMKKENSLFKFRLDFIQIFDNFKVLRILETLNGLVSRSSKMMSAFEFWLKLNTKCKGLTLPGIDNKLIVFNIKLIQSKSWFSQ